MFHYDYPLTVKPASMPWHLLPKQTWKDSLPTDMLPSSVSVLVVALPSSEVLEGLMNYTVHNLKGAKSSEATATLRPLKVPV
jgi:hypothetical protein